MNCYLLLGALPGSELSGNNLVPCTRISDVSKAKHFVPRLGNPLSGHCEAEEENTK